MNDQQAEFWQKCKEDIVFFATAKYNDRWLVWFKHVSKGRIPLGPNIYDWQVELLQQLQAGESIITEKSRRVGVSWTCCVFAIWLILFHPEPEVLFLSRKEWHAKKILKKAKFLYKNLPEWMKREVGTDSQERFSLLARDKHGEIAHEAIIDSLTTTGGSGRGEGARFVLADELAWMEDPEAVWGAISPTTADGGQIAAVSTHNGTGNTFYRILEEAKAGHSEFVWMSIHWKYDCHHTDEWFRKASKGMTAAQIGQEFELEAMISGTPAFNPQDVRACYMPAEDFPEVAEMIEKSTQLFSGIDSAEGKTHGKKGSLLPDYNSACVLNEFGVQVYAEHNRLPLTKWAGETIVGEDGERIEIPGRVSEIHAEFPGDMAIEKNAQGLVVINRHILPEDDVSEIHSRTMTNPFKKRIFVQLEHAIGSHQIIITDYFTYQCALVFQRVSTKISGQITYEAPAGHYDDPLIALGLAWDLALHSGVYDFDFNRVFASGQRVSTSPPEERELIFSMPSVISVPKETGGFSVPRDPYSGVMSPWHQSRRKSRGRPPS